MQRLLRFHSQNQFMVAVKSTNNPPGGGSTHKPPIQCVIYTTRSKQNENKFRES